LLANSLTIGNHHIPTIRSVLSAPAFCIANTVTSQPLVSDLGIANRAKGVPRPGWWQRSAPKSPNRGRHPRDHRAVLQQSKQPSTLLRLQRYVNAAVSVCLYFRCVSVSGVSFLSSFLAVSFGFLCFLLNSSVGVCGETKLAKSLTSANSGKPESSHMTTRTPQ
jgi:hypothetical protein